ncbi:MAG: polyprenyl synthetase family protein [Gammaproteobacteria bacterium]|nr:polyprenyl synthetase family protein [Gammaproteobacteria bacterium]
MNMDDCRDLVASEMVLVDELITRRLQSDVVLVNQLSGYIIGGGGKRLRPQLVLLAAGACGYSGRLHVDLAAIIEFIHTATLLHDDVVDASDLRRGRDTANSVWGNEAAVLVGDFLYSRAFEMMVRVDSLQVMDILAATTNRIAEGEVMQLMHVHEPDLTVDAYTDVIRAKTARLFEAATQLAGVVSGVTPAVEEALANYGNHLGVAFQIADDVLDYVSNSDDLGKEIGDDLDEGKPTLPLILAMRDGDENQRTLVADAIRTGGREQIESVLRVIGETGSLDKSMEYARREAELAIDALEALPDSEYRDALACIAHYSVERLH